jgi:hypothetical protein
MFTSYVKNKDSQDSIIFGDGNQGKVKGLGKIAISNEHSISNVFLVESLGYNLLSVSQLCNMGYNCLFTNVDVSVSPSAFEGEGAHWPCGRVGLRQRGAGRRRVSSASARRARRLGSWCPLLPEGGCRAVYTGGPPKISRAARAAFVFWGGPTFAPVRRLRAEVGASLAREDLSGDLPEG